MRSNPLGSKPLFLSLSRRTSCLASSASFSKCQSMSTSAPCIDRILGQGYPRLVRNHIRAGFGGRSELKALPAPMAKMGRVACAARRGLASRSRASYTGNMGSILVSLVGIMVACGLGRECVTIGPQTHLRFGFAKMRCDFTEPLSRFFWGNLDRILHGTPAGAYIGGTICFFGTGVIGPVRPLWLAALISYVLCAVIMLAGAYHKKRQLAGSRSRIAEGRRAFLDRAREILVCYLDARAYEGRLTGNVASVVTACARDGIGDAGELSRCATMKALAELLRDWIDEGAHSLALKQEPTPDHIYAYAIARRVHRIVANWFEPAR